MLQNGAKIVYAVDVGYGQLAWSLRNHAQVVNIERTNARYLTTAQLDGPVDFVSADLSFISLSLIFPVIARILGESGEAVCLIKPQFEAGRENVGKKGVVRDPDVHRDVVARVMKDAAAQGLTVRGLGFSPLKGPQGNIEYLLYCIKNKNAQAVLESAADEIVKKAHEALD
jgi:23S rRNA (cytidine1920-2'-O)/16S rRNA (cytidine1409-2'-O)-methyltransferase